MINLSIILRFRHLPRDHGKTRRLADRCDFSRAEKFCRVPGGVVNISDKVKTTLTLMESGTEECWALAVRILVSSSGGKMWKSQLTQYGDIFF